MKCLPLSSEFKTLQRLINQSSHKHEHHRQSCDSAIQGAPRYLPSRTYWELAGNAGCGSRCACRPPAGGADELDATLTATHRRPWNCHWVAAACSGHPTATRAHHSCLTQHDTLDSRCRRWATFITTLRLQTEAARRCASAATVCWQESVLNKHHGGIEWDTDLPVARMCSRWGLLWILQTPIEWLQENDRKTVK